MRTIDMMSSSQLADLRDAGRGHLIDGARQIDRADELRKLAKEEGAAPELNETEASS